MSALTSTLTVAIWGFSPSSLEYLYIIGNIIRTCYLNYGPHSSSINITWEFVRKVEYQASHELCSLEPVFFTRTWDDLYVY